MDRGRSEAPTNTEGRPAVSPSPQPPTIWPVLVAYALALALVLWATTGVVVAVALHRAHGHLDAVPDLASEFALSSGGVMVLALVPASVLAAVALALARLQKLRVSAALRLGRTRANAIGHVSAVLGMAGLSLASGAACDLLGWHGQGTTAAIAHALEHPTAGRLGFGILTIAVAPALSEECFFRGLMQTRLAARWGRWPSIATTATGFALMHGGLAQGSAAFPAGLFLGWLAERFNGIRPGILAHAFNNALFIAVASFGSPADATGSGAHTLVVLAIGSAACLASLVVLRSRLALKADAGSVREQLREPRHDE